MSLCTQRRRMISFAHPTVLFLHPRGCDPGTILTGSLCGLEPVWSFWRRKIFSIGNRNTIPRSCRSYSTLPTELSPQVPLMSSTFAFPLNSCIQRRQMSSLKSILFASNTLVTKRWNRYLSLNNKGMGCLK